MEPNDLSPLIRLALFIVFGATGTFLLLPHQHGQIKHKLAHRVGLGLMAVALLSFASLWQANVPTVPLAFFYVFGLTAIGSAVLTITSKNPIHSALWFASVVLSTAGLFLLSGAQFLAAGTIIVYAGAIIVTFLFVIMLAQMEGRATYDRMARSPAFATLSAFLMVFSLTYAIMALRLVTLGGDKPKSAVFEIVPLVKRVGLDPSFTAKGLADSQRNLSEKQKLILSQALPKTTAYLPESTGDRSGANRHVAGLGATLYTEHLVTIELAGTLLFAALIGALAIATPKAPIRPKTEPASLA